MHSGEGWQPFQIIRVFVKNQLGYPWLPILSCTGCLNRQIALSTIKDEWGFLCVWFLTDVFACQLWSKIISFGIYLWGLPRCTPGDSQASSHQGVCWFCREGFLQGRQRTWWCQQADGGEQIGAASEGRWKQPGSSTDRLAGGDAGRQLFGRLHGGLRYGAFGAEQPVFLRTSPYPPTKGSGNLSSYCAESLYWLSVPRLQPQGEIRHDRDELTVEKCA